LERWALHAEPLEQLLAVVHRSLRQALRRAFTDKALECADIDVDGFGLQSQRPTAISQARDITAREQLPGGEQRLAEIVSSALCRRVGPQECRQLLPWVSHAWLQGQVCEERLASRGQIDRSAGIEPDLDTTQQRKVKRRHTGRRCPRRPWAGTLRGSSASVNG